MFQNGKHGLGISSLFCCLGMGLAYVMGWVYCGKFNVTKVMLAWTVGIVLIIIGGAISPRTESLDLPKPAETNNK